jgi:uncharacterized protein YxeA
MHHIYLLIVAILFIVKAIFDFVGIKSTKLNNLLKSNQEKVNEYETENNKVNENFTTYNIEPYNFKTTGADPLVFYNYPRYKKPYRYPFKFYSSYPIPYYRNFP